MRLGLSSYAFPWSVGVPGWAPAQPLTALDLLDAADRLGVRVVQIADNLPLDDLPSEAITGLRARALELDIALELGTRGIAPDLLRRYLHLCTCLGSPILRTVIDTAAFQPSIDQIVAILRPLLPELAERSVTLAIENHDRFRARELVRLLQQIDSPWVAVCLDTANSLGALEGPEVVFPALAPWTANLHVKDFDLCRNNHGLGFAVEGRPAGQGMLDVPWLLELLRAHGKDPNAIIELWPPAEPTLEATISKERMWAEQSVTYMRQLVAV